MKLSFVIIFFLLSNLLFSQTSFELHYSTPKDEIVVDVLPMSDKFIAVGMQGDFILNQYNGLLLEIDSLGTITQNKVYNFDSSYTYLYKILNSEDSNFYLIGQIWSNGKNKINLIAKIDSNYNLLWYKSYGNHSYFHTPVDALIDNDTIFVYGLYHIEVNEIITSIGNYILKLNTFGDSIGYEILNPNGYNLAGSMNILNNNKSITTFNISSGESRIQILNSNLQIINSLVVPYKAYASISHKILNDSTILFCGRIDTFKNVLNVFQNIIVGIIKINGEVEHSTIIGSIDDIHEYYESVQSIALQNDKIYIAGYFGEENIAYQFTDHASKVLVSKLDLFLNKEWVKSYGKDSTFHYTYTIKPTPDKGIIIGAYSYDYQNSPTQQRDIYIIKLDSTGLLNTAIPEISKTALFKIYPNPAKEQITVEVPDYLNQQQLQLYIYDITGRCLLIEDITAATTAIKLKNLTTGVYFATLKNKKGEIETKRFILE